MGQVQLRQERLEGKLDQIKIDVTYLKSRSLVIDEGNAKEHKEVPTLISVIDE